MNYTEFSANRSWRFLAPICWEPGRGKKQIQHEELKYFIPDYYKSLEGTRINETDRLFRTQRKLKFIRQETDEKQKYLDMQWEELEADEKSLQNTVKSFSKFVEETEEKIKREKLKFENSRKGKKVLEKGCEKLKDGIDSLRYIQKKFMEEINKHTLYQEYLGKCVPYLDLRCVTDILNRYLSLEDAKDSLNKSSENSYNTATDLSYQQRNMVISLRDKTLQYNEDLSSHWQKYDNIKRRVTKWEKILLAVYIQLQNRWQEIFRAKEAMNHITCFLLTRMVTRMGSEENMPTDELVQILSSDREKMTFIKTMLGHLAGLSGKLNDSSKKKKKPGTIDTMFKTLTKKPSSSIIVTSKEHIPSGQDTKKTVGGKFGRPKLRKKTKFPKISPGTKEILARLEKTQAAEELRKKWEQIMKKARYHWLLFGTDSDVDDELDWYLTMRAREMKNRSKFHIGEESKNKFMKNIYYKKNKDISKKFSDLQQPRLPAITLKLDALEEILDNEDPEVRKRIIERYFNKYERKSILQTKISKMQTTGNELSKIELLKSKLTKLENKIDSPSMIMKKKKLESMPSLLNQKKK